MTSLQMSAQEELVERFLDAAARGDLNQLSVLLSHTPSLLNQTGCSGWTALMLATRNGHHHVVEKLLSLGCNKLCTNSSSQTAYDIAKFWGHRHIARVLSLTDDSGLHGGTLSPQENYLSRETLDRLSGKRSDAAWLEAKQRDPDTVYLLFSNLSPMAVVSKDNSGEVADVKLCRFRYDAVKDPLQKPATVLVFLGAEKTRNPPSSSSSSQTEQGTSESPVWFAINTDEDAAELLKRCENNTCFLPKSPNRDLLRLDEEEDGLVAQARSVLAWHHHYSFCPTCGSPTSLQEGGHKRSCLNPECRSLKGVHNTCYPRVGTSTSVQNWASEHLILFWKPVCAGGVSTCSELSLALIFCFYLKAAVGQILCLTDERTAALYSCATLTQNVRLPVTTESIKQEFTERTNLSDFLRTTALIFTLREMLCSLCDLRSKQRVQREHRQLDNTAADRRWREVFIQVFFRRSKNAQVNKKQSLLFKNVRHLEVCGVQEVLHEHLLEGNRIEHLTADELSFF